MYLIKGKLGGVLHAFNLSIVLASFQMSTSPFTKKRDLAPLGARPASTDTVCKELVAMAESIAVKARFAVGLVRIQSI